MYLNTEGIYVNTLSISWTTEFCFDFGSVILPALIQLYNITIYMSLEYIVM